VQVAIPPNGEDRARAFYVELLGFDEIPKPPELADRGGVWLRSADVNLHLGADQDFRPARKAHPALRCDDYDALLQRLAANGIIVNRDEREFEGKAHCYVRDPFGNRIELMAER
jgi:catechol 2,3-dioxygenase-like lactoylglutathione lyase family enzyme